MGKGSVRIYGIFGFLGAAWLMSACAENPSHLNTTYLDRYADPNPTLASILECHGFSCYGAALNQAENIRSIS
jgi:hypothetical protein